MTNEPDFASAQIERAKVIEYLLGSGTTAGRAKSRFFATLGFAPDRWEQLAEALRRQARDAQLASVQSEWGTKYVAHGVIDAPNGRQYKITSVWIAENETVRLVTAYPFKEASP